MDSMKTASANYQQLAESIVDWSQELGFSQVGISDIDLSVHEEKLTQWLENNYQGKMHYMERHGVMRARPAELVAGTVRVISVRLDYLPSTTNFSKNLLTTDNAYISRYALGRDYHKLMRKRLQKLGQKISEHCAQFNYRPFVDSAPIMERPLAEKAGLGWVGKHSLLINKEAGSWFFIGELLVDIPLPLTLEHSKIDNQCGSCTACITICPTDAIIEPYVVDARRCISYFTIESPDPIPVELRPLVGNRIYGCDDCQLICPWNKASTISLESDFEPRNNLDEITLLELFSWTESQFLSLLEGSPIRRIGFQSWQRNIAVALGNANYQQTIVDALSLKLKESSAMVTEHINWALEQQSSKKTEPITSNMTQLDKRLIRSLEKINR